MWAETALYYLVFFCIGFLVSGVVISIIIAVTDKWPSDFFLVAIPAVVGFIVTIARYKKYI
jgi:hypothetical protein